MPTSSLLRGPRTCALILAIGSVLACAPAGGRSADPGVVRIGWAGSPDSLNPGVGVLAKSYVLYGLVYDALFQLELDGSFSPCLATSWTHSTDRRTWTFKLRAGATFHDGVPVTSRDVKFSLDLYKAHSDFPYLHGYTESFDSVEAPDPATVVLHLRQAIPNLESQLVFLFILPEHIWAPWADRATQFPNRAMVGSGPFRLVDFKPNEYIRLAAFRRHPLSPPKASEVLFVTYGSFDALVQAVRTGQVDAITELPYTAVAALRRAPQVSVAVGAPMAPGTYDLKLDQRDPASCPPAGGVCSGHPALRDVRVRRALAMATPKQEIIDVVLMGFGLPGRTLIPDALGAWYDRDLADYPYDPAAARSLLDEAGYRDRDGDGVREMPDGSRSLDFRLFYPSDSPALPRAAELVARAWSRIGVKVERRAEDSSALAAARAPAFDYDVILWSWSSDPDPSFLLSVMTSDEISGGGNDTGWTNPEYDRLYRAQAVELDPDRRRAMIWRMQQIALDGLPYIVPFYPRAVEAYRTDRFRGWKTDQPLLALEDRSTLVALEPVPRKGEP